MRPSLYEFAGGADAFLSLAAAHHARCLADPELNHPFSHPDQDPEHVPRLAAYWAEVMGGPARFSETYSSQTSMLRMHAGNGDMTDLGVRFVQCFTAAMDDADLPADVEFRAVMQGYIQWAVADVLVHSDDPDEIPDGIGMPHWGWDGLVLGTG
jgi:hemoglobin